MSALKRYVLRKFILAHSAKEALEKEPDTPVADVFIEERPAQESAPVDAIGFKFTPPPSHDSGI